MSMAEVERKASFSEHLKKERNPWTKEEAGSGWGKLRATEAEERKRTGGDEVGEKRSDPTGAVDPGMRLGAEKTESIGSWHRQWSENSMARHCREMKTVMKRRYYEVSTPAAPRAPRRRWQEAAAAAMEGEPFRLPPDIFAT